MANVQFSGQQTSPREGVRQSSPQICSTGHTTKSPVGGMKLSSSWRFTSWRRGLYALAETTPWRSAKARLITVRCCILIAISKCVQEQELLVIRQSKKYCGRRVQNKQTRRENAASYIRLSTSQYGSMFTACRSTQMVRKSAEKR